MKVDMVRSVEYRPRELCWKLFSKVVSFKENDLSFL